MVRRSVRRCRRSTSCARSKGKSALGNTGHRTIYSIASSTRAISDGGTVRLSLLAVLRLIDSSYYPRLCGRMLREREQVVVRNAISIGCEVGVSRIEVIDPDCGSSPALCGSGIFLRLMTARTISIDRSGRGRQQKRSGRLKSPIRYCNMGDLFIFVRYPTKQGRRRSGNRARMAKETCYGSEIRNVWQNHSNL